MVFTKEGYSACYLDHEGFKNSNALERPRPISDHCMKGTTYASFSESKIYDRLHDVFTFFLF